MAFLLPALGSLASTLLPGVGRVISGALGGGINALENEFKPKEEEKKQVKHIEREEREEDGDLEDDLEDQLERIQQKKKIKASYRKPIRKQVMNFRTVQGKQKISNAQLAKMMHNKRSKHY